MSPVPPPPPLVITPEAAVIKQNDTQTFVASGGTGPYVFALVSGLGAIDDVTGIYTAPNSSGSAVVSVTDSQTIPVTVQATITIHTALTLVCDILQTEMNLSDGQVYLWDQKLDVPNDQNLYIAVGVLTCKPFANTRVLDGSGSGLNEIQSTNFQAILSIDIISRGTEARDRKEEIIMALKSIYAEQQMEAFGFFIAPLSSGFVNLSEVDGSAIPYRFNVSVAVQYFVTKTKAVDYYDTFQENDLVTDP